MSDATKSVPIASTSVILTFFAFACVVAGSVGCLKSPDGGEIQSWSGADRAADDAAGAGGGASDTSNGGATGGGTGVVDTGVGVGVDSGRFAPGAPGDTADSPERGGRDGGTGEDPGACYGDVCTSPCPDGSVHGDVDGDSSRGDTARCTD